MWDAGLSSQAQKWAENCVSEHSIKPGENKGYGENIASRGVVQPGSSDILDDKTAKKEMLKAMNNPEKGGWYDEKANYAYPNCPGDPTMANKNCGHYTQVTFEFVLLSARKKLIKVQANAGCLG